MAIKTKIKYAAKTSQEWWRKEADGKNSHKITVVADDGKEYRVKVLEGTPQWELPVGAEINIELRTHGKTGEQYAVLEGTPLPAPKQGFGGGYQRREYKTPTKEQAAEAADFIASLFKAIKGRTGLDDETVATLTVAAFEKLC